MIGVPPWVRENMLNDLNTVYCKTNALNGELKNGKQNTEQYNNTIIFATTYKMQYIRYLQNNYANTDVGASFNVM